MRPESLLSTWLRKWREAKSRPVQRETLQTTGFYVEPGCHRRHKRVCVDFFPATPQPPGTQKLPGMRFLGIAESIGPMGAFNTLKKLGAGVPPPVGRPRGPAKGRDGRSAPCSSSAMSSDRLFLDRVARQQSPSPLHRQPDHKTVDESQKTDYHRTVTASFPPCLTEGVHPTYSCSFVFIRGSKGLMAR